MSNAPVLDVELVNGATYTINTAELRGKGSNGGAIAKESLGQNSFRSFAVSDPQKYRAQAFGYFYEGDGTDDAKNHGIAFNSGAVTDINDPVFDTGDAIKYKGDAYLASRGDNVKGSSDIDVYFADKQLEGDFTFAAGQKRTTPGKENEDAKYPGKIDFSGIIDGNTFEAWGSANNHASSKMTVNGRFYGAGATEMGGSFFDYYAQYVGSFGAIRQTAIPSDADNNSNTGNNDNGNTGNNDSGNTGNNDNGNTNPQEPPKDSGLGDNQLSSRTIGDYQKVPAADIKGSGNKLALTVKGTEINSEELRALGNKLGVAAGNPVDNSAYKTNQSYQYFAVSDDKYAAQTFGYVYNKANDKGTGDNQAVAFSVGKLTPETDAVLKPASKDSLKYSGDAFIGDNVGYQPIVKGTSLFNVSFFDKKSPASWNLPTAQNQAMAAKKPAIRRKLTLQTAILKATPLLRLVSLLPGYLTKLPPKGNSMAKARPSWAVPSRPEHITAPWMAALAPAKKQATIRRLPHNLPWVAMNCRKGRQSVRTKKSPISKAKATNWY